ncbi:hypothetical protein H8356DRAFT_1038012 [Neocallimastix lanati (nom. inval.)]|jgi:hypothetical protein|nr:hypothetical protein H8356DRAFT_1038012 [Neocallimastix sp. JGI-2020a]
MNTAQVNFSSMDYAKFSNQDENDSGYTELNTAFTSFEKQYQMNFNVTDMETENIFEQRNFNQECEDDASDFYPSDPDDTIGEGTSKIKIEQKRKKYQTRALKIFRDLTENMSAPWRDELDVDNAFISNMYKFNEEKQRWVKKGPVVIFLLKKQFRLVTYNLYGQQAPSLNIKLWEFMSKYSKNDDHKILISSFGRNFKNKVLINTSIAYLKDVIDTSRLNEYELSLIQNKKVNICNSTVIPYPEEDSSNIVFYFKATEDLKRFMEAFDKACNELYYIGCQKRYNTFINEQPVLNYQDHPVNKVCQYPYKNQDLFIALSQRGFEYKPIEDETGKLLNDRVKCSFCGTSYAGWFTNYDSIDSVHRQHHNSIQYRCPFLNIN